MADRIITVTDPSVVTNDTLIGYNNYSDIDGQLGTTMTPTEAANGHTVVLTDGLVHQVTSKPVGAVGTEPNGEFTGVVSNAVTVDLASGGWGLAGASYDSISKDVETDTSFPSGLWFRPDGLKVYCKDNAGGVAMMYDLSSAWDLSSAGAVIKSTTATGAGCFVSVDGTKIYFINGSNHKILSYTMTAWDLSTLAVSNEGSPLGLPTTNNAGLFIKDTGDLVIVASKDGTLINSYSMTSWDITTLDSTPTASFDATAQDTGFHSVYFKEDGLRMYLIGETDSTIYQYTLSVAWDVSSAIYGSLSLAVSTQDSDMRGIFIKPDGLKMYLAGITSPGDSFYQYSLT